MIASFQDLLAWAEVHKAAIGAFNTPNVESLQAVIHSAQALGLPVIISHAQLHEASAPLDQIGPLMVLLAEQATVPVGVHLDHGNDLAYLEAALKLGFTSVMYDGSDRPYADNVALTAQAASLARRYGAGIEGELGAVFRDGRPAQLTDASQAGHFASQTQIDALAASFGTLHGLYTHQPRLSYQRIAQVRQASGLPLVLHGGSGLAADTYRQAIAAGIRKINAYTYLAKAATDRVRALLQNKAVTDFHDVSQAATQAIQEEVTGLMRLFTEHSGAAPAGP